MSDTPEEDRTIDELAAEAEEDWHHDSEAWARRHADPDYQREMAEQRGEDPDALEAGPHLWESEHGYPCAPENWYKHRDRSVFPSWVDFLVAFGEGSRDLNLVFRWDWDEEKMELFIGIIHQRKGRYWPVVVKNMKPEDELSVRHWLQRALDHLVSEWAPLIPAPAGRFFGRIAGVEQGGTGAEFFDIEPGARLTVQKRDDAVFAPGEILRFKPGTEVVLQRVHPEGGDADADE
jgi:hypothetical protein